MTNPLTGTRGQFLIDWLLVLAMTRALTGADGNGMPSRNCSTSFNFLRDAYRSCALYRRPNGSRDQHQHVTGGDVIVGFQEVCSSRSRMEKCKNTVLEGCSKKHLETYQTAVDKSLWFCDEDNNIRGVITRALTGEEAVPDRERNKTTCIQESELYSCPRKILEEKRFGRFKSYGNVIKHDAHKVLTDPLVKEYFKALFDCYYDVVRTNCPYNAIPMVIESQGHLFSPPKFGVNVSEIILMKELELRRNKSD